MRPWIDARLSEISLDDAAAGDGRVGHGDVRSRRIAAGLLLAAGALAASLAAEGRGLDVVLVELFVMGGLVATAVVARPVVAAWIPALVAVGVVEIVPFMLPLPTLAIGPRTAAVGAVQLLAVGAVVRHCVLTQPPGGAAAEPPASVLAVVRPVSLRPAPRFAWPVAVLAGVGLGLLAHALVHFGPTTSPAPLADFWRMGTEDQATELVGVVIIGVAVEEALFRLVLAPLSRAALGRWSILFDGALYATLYGASRSVWWCLVVLAVGTLAAWYRLRYGRFGPVVLAHAVASALAFVILR